MAKIEYLTAERKHRYGDNYSYYALGYGSSFDEDSFFSRLGRDGWEMISDNGREIRFKRMKEEESSSSSYSYLDNNNYSYTPATSYDNSSDYSEELERVIRLLAEGFIAMDKHLAKLEASQVMLTGLIEALVDKFCPDSEFLKSFKATMTEAGAPASDEAPKAASSATPEEKFVEKVSAEENVTEEVSAEETFTEEDFVEEELFSGFADEHIENVMKGYEDDDKSLQLFAILVGLGVTLPHQTAEAHQRYMIKALYRFYNKNADEKIKDCYVNMLQKASFYLSSPGTIKQLNEITGADMTVTEATDSFFNVISAQLLFEKKGSSPFKVGEIGEFISNFVREIKGNEDLCEDGELSEKISGYRESIKQKYGLEADAD